MAYVAVLDANVLHPHICVDLLLRLAERGLFRPAWSHAILDELRVSLIRRNLPPANVERRISSMVNEFPEASIDGAERFLPVVPSGTDPGDRHVVAAALAARADGIVTQNVTDFSRSELAGLGIELQSLDEFLLNQWTLAPQIVLEVLADMEVDRQRPPKTVAELLAALERRAPSFVANVRASGSR